MKKILSIIALLVIAIGYSACAMADQRVKPDQVPQGLKTYITENFGPGVKIIKAERERIGNFYEYEVTLDNAVEITYASNDIVLEVDGNGNKLPDQIVGDKILSHVASVYPGAVVTEIKCKSPGYEVKLSNGKELLYNSSRIFVREDD